VAAADAASPTLPDAADAASVPVVGDLPWPEANAIVAAVRAPVFPDARFVITDFGATVGGTDSTAAIAKAVAACAQAGGGHVVVPAGTFTTGAVELLDNVDLHLEAGATLAFSGDVSRYPTVLTRSDGIELMGTSPPVYAHGRKNIALTGSGVLDAAATASWNNESGGGTQTLQGWGRAGTPVAQRTLPAGGHVRVSFVEPYACENVLVQGVTLRNAAFWTLHPTLSKNVLVDGVTIETSVHNADGCDPESCTNVVIKNATFATTDDCVAIKSGRDQEGLRLHVPSENVVVMHSKFRSSYGMLTIGSQESGGVHHVFGYDLTTTGPVKYVLWIKSNRERGGDVADVRVDSVQASDVSVNVVWATLAYEWNGTSNGVPSLDQIVLSHITVDGAPQVLKLEGLPNSPIGAFRVQDSTFTKIANAANSVVNVKDLQFDKVTVNGKPAP
jgi:polygalacturonase